MLRVCRTIEIIIKHCGLQISSLKNAGSKFIDSASENMGVCAYTRFFVHVFSSALREISFDHIDY